MSMMSFGETLTREKSAAYGGFADAIGGLATIVLAIIGLAGMHSGLMVEIATVVFGASLLIQGGAMLSEYAGIMFPSGTRAPIADHFGGGSLSSVFLVGGTGIVLGVLALLGIGSLTLCSIALIGFGTALVLSSRAVWHLYNIKRAMMKGEEEAVPGSEFLASEMASGSAAIQALTGLTAVILGILALVGTGVDSVVLVLVALLVLGGTLVLTGSAWSGTVMRFMKHEAPESGSAMQTSSPRTGGETWRSDH
jgi:hypothetical protein